MNPARSLAPALVSGNLHALWVYLTAPIIGSAISIPLWRATRGNSAPAPLPQSTDAGEKL
jgi:aquaporin Z